MNDSYAMQAARQDREIADLRARLAAAEAQVKSLTTKLAMAELSDERRELAEMVKSLTEERDAARASAPEMFTHLAEQLKAHAREEAEAERDEARAELATVEHRDAYRVERDEARARDVNRAALSPEEP